MQFTNVIHTPQSPCDQRSQFSSSFQVAESMGFKGDFRQWQELLRIGD
jgi:hypothetical protein